MLDRLRPLFVLLVTTTACGGTSPTPSGPTVDSDSTVVPPGEEAPEVVPLDELKPVVSPSDDAVAESTEDASATTAEEEAPAVTFVLKNLDPDRELVFSVDKGWQPILFAYSGEPPNAKSILLYPKHCTAACDTPETERCPSCPQPEKVAEVKAAEKRITVPSGHELQVPWDGQIFLYQDDPAGCECHARAPVPAETYTVTACGFRITKVATERSIYQCERAQMTVPADEPQRVRIDFPAKAPAGKG